MHRRLISDLQEKIKACRLAQKKISLHYRKGSSNTTRSKSYKNGCASIACGALNQILSIDPIAKKAHVAPRVTMEELIRATLPFGLMPPVVPEFKGITVGGAIMGAAAESGSHRWGIFHDLCTSIEMLDGKGSLICASSEENADLFYGISGSYGSLGLLVSAEINLVSVLDTVHIRYHRFSEPQKGLQAMEKLIGHCDFLDGVIFSKDHCVIAEGKLIREPSSKSSSKWYAQHLKNLSSEEEKVPLFDYLFRYDQGAFWMGTFLFSLPFLKRYIRQGLLKHHSSDGWFTHHEIELFKNLPFPNAIARTLAHPLMQSQRLWKLLHKAEKWVQDRLVIQDFCITLPNAGHFLQHILDDPGVFPIWLCPLKGTHTPQLFAPHFGHPFFINFGLYGVPAYSAPMETIIQSLEEKTHALQGRKVLYARSYYTEENFWNIYSKERYEALRQKTHADGIWHGLTEKVLSE